MFFVFLRLCLYCVVAVVTAKGRGCGRGLIVGTAGNLVSHQVLLADE